MFTYYRTPKSLLIIVTRLGVGQFGIRILAAARDFSVLQIVHTVSGTHITSHVKETGAFPQSSVWDHDPEISPPSSVKVKNEWSYISAPPIRLHGLNRDNFIFFYFGATAPSGPGPPHSRCFYITHNDAPHSVELLWTSDRPVAETSI